MSKSYEDILHLPRPIAKGRPSMPIADRAAQFSPFAALTGYGEAIDETIRDTTEQCFLSEEEIAALNAQLVDLQKKCQERPTIQVTHFVPDAKKEGGAYKKSTLQLKKIDDYSQTLIGTKGEKIPFTSLIHLQEIVQESRER